VRENHGRKLRGEVNKWSGGVVVMVKCCGMVEVDVAIFCYSRCILQTGKLPFGCCGGKMPPNCRETIFPEQKHP
jgi:hypothetical protein